MKIVQKRTKTYEIVQKIGRGKYSDVFKAIKLGSSREQDTLSVLKILKPSILRVM